MMKKCIGICGALMGLHVMLSGCSTLHSTAPSTPTVHANHTKSAVDLDGVLNEPVWQQAKAYPMALSTDQSTPIQEGGHIRIAYDDHYLYLGATVTDSDVLQERDEDQQMHFESGDLLELFLKPVDAPYYWELYVTPNQRKTVFFFEGAGRRFLPSSYKHGHTWLQVAAHVNGTLNDPSDRDEGWSAEMAIPLATLAEKGIPLDNEHPWKIFIGRYNFTIHLPAKELSMTPAQSITSFHMPASWANLQLTP